MAAAYAGRTWGDLLDLTNDLPAEVRLGADLTATQSPRPADQQRPWTPLPLRFVRLAPLLLAGVALTSLYWGVLGYPDHHHHYLSFVPVWLVVVVVVFLRRTSYRYGRGRTGRFR